MITKKKKKKKKKAYVLDILFVIEHCSGESHAVSVLRKGPHGEKMKPPAKSHVSELGMIFS